MALERNDQRMLLIGVAILIVALALAGLMGKPAGPASAGTPQPSQLVQQTGQRSFTGYGNSNSETTLNITINETNMIGVTFDLTWQDEPNQARHTNLPDNLGLEVSSPEGEGKSGTKSNAQGGTGEVKLTYSYNVTEKTIAQKTSKRGTGSWNVVVMVGSCGAQEPRIPDPGGYRTVADNGNAYTLTVSYQYFGKETKAAK